MSSFSERVEIEAAANTGFCVNAEVFHPGQGALTREQKIARVFLLWRDSVYRYLLTVFGHPAEAEEITQEAFLRLYRCLLQGAEIGNARSWIFRVAHNLALDQQKSRKYLEATDTDAFERLCQLREDPAPNPEQRVLQLERLEWLHAALARLSAQERQCLQLRAEGFRYREIAEVLGIGVSTVTDSLRRGITKLTKDAHA